MTKHLQNNCEHLLQKIWKHSRNILEIHLIQISNIFGFVTYNDACDKMHGYATLYELCPMVTLHQSKQSRPQLRCGTRLERERALHPIE
jgi:hypothetical protein